MKRRFLLDGMLGRLCRKMRMLGLDCELVAPGRSPYFLADAEADGRTAVTTATRPLDRRGRPPIVLCLSGAAEMIAELFIAIGETPELEPFTICLECNKPLREISPQEAEPRVPPRIAREFKEFRECVWCGRVYWKGSHYEAMEKQVEQILGRAK